ncbi:hypothetical protein SRB17_03740 [Streptomyces sp. RB17]|nr:hypothetical protein [Streptomyces sp. RB17]
MALAVTPRRVGPSLSKSGPSRQIAAMATAVIVRPMLAMSEP